MFTILLLNTTYFDHFSSKLVKKCIMPISMQALEILIFATSTNLDSSQYTGLIVAL